MSKLGKAGVVVLNLAAAAILVVSIADLVANGVDSKLYLPGLAAVGVATLLWRWTRE